MRRLFQQISASPLLESLRRDAIQRFLANVPTTEAVELATESADPETLDVLRDNREETIVNFRLKSLSVRLMHCKDVDMDLNEPFLTTRRFRSAQDAAKMAFDEDPMTVPIQQIVMARRVLRVEGSLRAALAVADQSNKKAQRKFLEGLRSDAREEFWLDWSPSERDALRQTVNQPNSANVERLLVAIRGGWSPAWNSKRYNPDFFQHYLKDSISARSVWQLVDVDLLVVTDCRRRVIFANLERAAQLLFGEELAGKLAETIDMWSFFTPMPLPETTRHVVDHYVRRLHPELDIAKATVENLHRAKMAVAHYGCWSSCGDPHGKHVVRTYDARFVRSVNAEEYPQLVFPEFGRSVFGHCTEIVRFLVQNAAPEHYSLCRAVYDQLSPDVRLATTKEDFLSLFALGINGYTQRHTDSGDMVGGYAGLITLGSYTGGNLCIPDLGIKVTYAPGACTILRGDKMEHLVTDYSGPRYFVIGTNHEAVKRWAVRRMPGYQDEPGTESAAEAGPGGDKEAAGAEVVVRDEFDDPDEELVEFPPKTPCVNTGCDWDEDEVADHEWTNEELHGAAALLPMTARAAT
ncbi:hypothetical protein PG988_015935 [Apiospora saccharicola]